MIGDYDLPSGDMHWPCHAGSGECKSSATKVRNDGAGGEAYYCDKHASEFDHMERWLSIHPELCKPFEEAIRRVE